MRTRADSPTKTCTIDGCTRPLRARGMCGTHYNQTRYAPGERHKTVTVPCSQCGKQCSKRADPRHAFRFCSYECRHAWRLVNQPYEAPSAAQLETMWAASRSRRQAAQRKLRKAARGTRGMGVMVAGLCRRCRSPFVSLKTNDAGLYCSNACKRRTRSSRRRARQAGARHESYSPVSIFERDRYRCHLCRRPTLRSRVVPHPRAPTIDHLVPLAEGGDDTAANVATACFLCNSTKSHRGGGEQLALIG